MIGRSALILIALAGAAGADEAALELRAETGTIPLPPNTVEAEPSSDMYGQPVLMFSMAPNEAAAFGDMTAANIGRPIEVVVCGEVLTSPVIREMITGGVGMISGSFTVSEIEELARRINEADCTDFNAPAS